MNGLRTNSHAIVVAFQRNFFVAATRKEFRVHAELLRPVPGHSAAHCENPHALGGQHGVGEFLEIFEGIKTQQRSFVFEPKNLVQSKIDAQLGVREGRNKNRNVFLVRGLENSPPRHGFM